MSSLRKQLNGAYEQIECVKAIGVKYCEDNTLGQQPMLDFYDNKLSVDAPIVNDLHDNIFDEFENETEMVNDMNTKVGMSIIVDILNLFTRRN